MIDKMPLVNIKHNKKIFLGRKIYCAQNLAKSEFLNLTFILGKFFKHFSDLPKICPRIFPPDFPIQKFLPYTFYRGSKRCYSPNQNREKKCTNLQNNSSHWCVWLDEKFLVKKKLLRLFLDGTLPSSKFFMENLI